MVYMSPDSTYKICIYDIKGVSQVSEGFFTSPVRYLLLFQNSILDQDLFGRGQKRRSLPTISKIDFLLFLFEKKTHRAFSGEGGGQNKQYRDFHCEGKENAKFPHPPTCSFIFIFFHPNIPMYVLFV